MSAESEDHFEALEAYVQTLPEEERRALGAVAHQSPLGVFDLVKSGDAAGLYAALEHDPSLMERQDENGMTPLHWAGIDQSGLLFDVLTSEPSGGPWTRDNVGRLPLDVMREAGQHAVADKAERITYPQLYRDEEASPVKREQVAAFERKHEALGKPNTRPSYARNLEPLDKTPEPRATAHNRDERGR